MNKISKEDRFPQWLRSLLKINFFFHPCEIHSDSFKKECNMYCLDCTGPALCYSCLADHKDHHVVQIRKSSYYDVVRICDVSKFIDVSDVQPYIVNGATIVFLEERLKPRFKEEGVKYTCKTCHGKLPEPFQFCSLRCKRKGLKKDPELTFALRPKLSRDVSKNADIPKYFPAEFV
ncbi:PLATZ transcription factor family protein [Rhynchospora pubera]|uniref:PLATZ transcription factor family protein n=1 Tax=Rhynchospora pubera TaxID=906938 RepID=A0AAV8E5V1_9POAL|nr:PLATZ transcription factor family protein [Rhynchospora pubera]